MTLRQLIEGRFEIHGNRGHIADTALNFLDALERFGPDMKTHVCRVALMSEAVARKLGRDFRAAFYAGLLHDYGKILMPEQLFDGHDVSTEEVEAIRTHAEKGFELLKEVHLFSALVAGLHHEVGSGKSYGIRCEDIPDEISPETLREVIDLARMVSASDYADAAVHRQTVYHGPESGNLRERMMNKYGQDGDLVDSVLEEVEHYRGYVSYE